MNSKISHGHIYSAIQASILTQSYASAISHCRELLLQYPDSEELYHYLGLSLLLQDNLQDAQALWFERLLEREGDEVDKFSQALVKFLEIAALEHETRNLNQEALLIRRCIYELQPENINNLLNEIGLSVQSNKFSSEYVNEVELIAYLDKYDEKVYASLDRAILFSTVFRLLQYAPLADLTHELTIASYAIIGNENGFSEALVDQCLVICNDFSRPDIVVYLLEHYCAKYPTVYATSFYLAAIYTRMKRYNEGTKVAEQLYHISTNTLDKVMANYQWIHNLLYCGGEWEAAQQQANLQDVLLSRILDEGLSPDGKAMPIGQLKAYALRLTTPTYVNAYLRDDLKLNRYFQNEVFSLSYRSLQAHQNQYASDRKIDLNINNSEINNSEILSKKLKIGYISHCFRCHSVGWLARWIIHNHDRERYQLYGYMMLARESEPLQEWYSQQFDYVRKFATLESNDTQAIHNQIVADKVDILVDLDSFTLGLTCAVLTLKPAPIQVSWLGCDAPGLPTVDYFIADPYVLPDWAQEYYLEKIWRLPYTYIAVKGFELGVPSLRRDTLGIPSDAIVYFSGQAGLKRNPRFMFLQLKILASVPGSHLVIAGLSDQESIREHLYGIAEQVGVEQCRLHFLERVSSEAIHRANLTLMDIALDTYPYNGATTTLELLWVGVPIVTRVGEQFTSRNSYTMMVNAGIEEGIAWTDEEYVEWGIRLGRNESLRQQIHWKLMRSRHTAPLWNAQQFTRDMEAAYEKMWSIYCQNN